MLNRKQYISLIWQLTFNMASIDMFHNPHSIVDCGLWNMSIEAMFHNPLYSRGYNHWVNLASTCRSVHVDNHILPMILKLLASVLILLPRFRSETSYWCQLLSHKKIIVVAFGVTVAGTVEAMRVIRYRQRLNL